MKKFMMERERETLQQTPTFVPLPGQLIPFLHIACRASEHNKIDIMSRFKFVATHRNSVFKVIDIPSMLLFKLGKATRCIIAPISLLLEFLLYLNCGKFSRRSTSPCVVVFLKGEILFSVLMPILASLFLMSLIILTFSLSNLFQVILSVLLLLREKLFLVFLIISMFFGKNFPSMVVMVLSPFFSHFLTAHHSILAMIGTDLIFMRSMILMRPLVMLFAVPDIVQMIISSFLFSVLSSIFAPMLSMLSIILLPVLTLLFLMSTLPLVTSLIDFFSMGNVVLMLFLTNFLFMFCSITSSGLFCALFALSRKAIFSLFVPMKKLRGSRVGIWAFGTLLLWGIIHDLNCLSSSALAFSCCQRSKATPFSSGLITPSLGNVLVYNSFPWLEKRKEENFGRLHNDNLRLEQRYGRNAHVDRHDHCHVRVRWSKRVPYGSVRYRSNRHYPIGKLALYEHPDEWNHYCKSGVGVQYKYVWDAGCYL